ncbi:MULTISPECIES: hypothetical protein [Halorussus]|uniref:hypothetical protein n=1 Tax=Halorussus TaxID=1070314 RepID=UPI0018787D20|nr:MULTISPECIES: hypothetical protein [Halorussus]
MNFGVISTANIGRAAVVPAIQDTDHVVLAVASRDADAAAAFADDLGIPRAYGSYDELLAESAKRGEPVSVEGGATEGGDV